MSDRWQDLQDYEIDGREHEAGRIRRERMIDDLRDALEKITATAACVLSRNTPEFLEHLRERIADATEMWERTARHELE